MSLLAYAFTRLILVAAVVSAFQYAVLGLYAISAMFVFALGIYAYLIYFGGRPIEKRLLGPPEPPHR